MSFYFIFLLKLHPKTGSSWIASFDVYLYIYVYVYHLLCLNYFVLLYFFPLILLNDSTSILLS